jgi:dihydrofolate synthase / folylpolyglutamate synthase
MSYAAAIESLFALAGELHTPPGQARRKFELEQMRVLAAALGDPQTKFPSVLIAGTNGKGSTSATLAAILRAAGYRVGLYTSPHLASVNERIRIDGADISDDDFARFYFHVDDTARRLVDEGKLPAPPSFFESMTALAFTAFAEARVDIAVLEVGMGGRLDATNIVEPLVSVITDISLDHTEWLGPTITAIAHEKAGILRENGVMVTLPQHPEANTALGEVAMSLNVRGVNAAEYIPSRTTHSPEHFEDGRNHYVLRVEEQSIAVDSPLAGQHQQRNLALAIATAVELRNNHSYKITTADIARGIRETRWPGRMERFTAANGAAILLDVGHNPAGAWALRSVLADLESRAPKTLIFGCLRDKPVTELAQILFPLFDMVLLTPVNSPRSATLDELSAAAAATRAVYERCADARQALDRSLEITPATGLIVGTGSVYLVGALRSELKP